ncbi:MAG TPA: hypothetical protein VFD92_07400 [Candidatus Binatia bacterium]|nr:hypothetical protein [Candidatus Binatia bacterium]
MDLLHRTPAGMAGLETASSRNSTSDIDRVTETIVRPLPRRRSRNLLRVAAGFALLALAAVGAAAPARAYATGNPAFECAVAKQKAALRRLQSVNRCVRGPSQLGNQQPTPVCLTRAQERFEQDFMRIEANGGCVPSTGDANEVGQFADQCALGIAARLPGTCLQAGSLCGGGPPCCAGLACVGQIGQLPVCQ